MYSEIMLDCVAGGERQDAMETLASSWSNNGTDKVKAGEKGIQR